MRPATAAALLLVLAATAAEGRSPEYVGVWDSAPNALPNPQLPHVPLLGNGQLGAAVDGSSHDRAPYPFPGTMNSIDVYLNTNSFWSCVDRTAPACQAADPDGVAPACCSVVALGGISFSLRPTFTTPLSFTAAQFLANGTVEASLATAAGSRLVVVAAMLPDAPTVAFSLTWRAAPADSPYINVSVLLWVQGGSGSAGTGANDNTGGPAPRAVGCASIPNESTTTSESEAHQSCRHHNPHTFEPCAALPQHEQLLFATRTAATDQHNTTMPVLATLAARISTRAATYRVLSPAGAGTGDPAVVAAIVTLTNNTEVGVVVGEAESRGPAGLVDPAPQALELASQYTTTEIFKKNADFFSDFWEQSGIDLPTRPRVEQLWYGALNAVVGFSSDNPNIAAGGLYGPWATVDGPNWHGDYTLDYNYASSFFGVFGANHPERTASYYKPISDWLDAGRLKAQRQAALAHVHCPATALYYACHLAPWGLQSLDTMMRYMSWNGHFAVLPFLSHFEYTRNVDFALNTTLPLLAGLNDWWACFLNKTEDQSAPDGYYYNDVNTFNPDYEHEGQQVPNPTIAMSFVQRTIGFHVDLFRQLNLTVPPILADIAAHLPPPNIASLDLPANFTQLNNTRCHNDAWTWPNVPDAPACQALCMAQPGCMFFTACPPVGEDGCTGTRGQPTPLHCWGYHADAACTAEAGWSSGKAAAHTAQPVFVAYRGARTGDSDWFSIYPIWPTESLNLHGNDAGEGGAAQSSEKKNASIKSDNINQKDINQKNDINNKRKDSNNKKNDSNNGSSSSFESSDPSFSSSTISSTPTSTTTAAAAAQTDWWATAELSSRFYLDLASGRGVDVFAMAVRSGSRNPAALTPTDVLQGLEQFMDKYFGPNFLCYAPGGGIENTGMLQAVNEMLLFAVPNSPSPGAPPPAPLAEYTLILFPFWPAAEPAAFTTLLAKGGHVVSASWNNATRAVDSPVTITARYMLGHSPMSSEPLAHQPGRGRLHEEPSASTSRVSVRLPWPREQTLVQCEGATPPAPIFSSTVVTFTTALAAPCRLVRQAQ